MENNAQVIDFSAIKDAFENGIKPGASFLKPATEVNAVLDKLAAEINNETGMAEQQRQMEDAVSQSELGVTKEEINPIVIDGFPVGPVTIVETTGSSIDPAILDDEMLRDMIVDLRAASHKI